jgi:RHS repeat-associated protein
VRTKYFYDAQGQMVRVESQNAENGAWRVKEFRYDPFGRRNFMWQDSTQNRFIYAGDARVYAVNRPPGDTSDADVFHILYTPGPSAPTMLSYSHRSTSATTESRFLHRDDQGSALELSRAGGKRDHSGPPRYLTFGTPDGDLFDNGRDANTGQAMDSEVGNSGLVYLKNRYYDPGTGRFVQEDPIGFAGGINLYAYAGDNPASYTDPFGLSPCPSCVRLLLGAGGAAAIDGPLPFGDVVATGLLAAAGVMAAGAAVGEIANSIREKTYVTYTLTNAQGQIYVGRASGYGDPHSVMMRRFASHERRAMGFGNPTLDRAATGPLGAAAIRGREQQLVDALGGIGSPRVANRIRGVSEFNPAGRFYHAAANAMFGELAPYTGRF